MQHAPSQWPSARAFYGSHAFALRNCLSMVGGTLFFVHLGPKDVPKLLLCGEVGCAADDSRWASRSAGEFCRMNKFGLRVDTRALAEAMDLFSGRGRAGARLLRTRLLGWRRAVLDPRARRPGDVEARCRGELALMDCSPLSVTPAGRRAAGVPHLAAYLQARGAWPGARRFCEIWDETHPAEPLVYRLRWWVSPAENDMRDAAFRAEMVDFSLDESQAECDARFRRAQLASPQGSPIFYVWRAGELPCVDTLGPN